MATEQTEGAQRARGNRTDAAWRERAVERSLRRARARAVSRSDRFLAAASELLAETGRIDFTVQDIVDRSKMSLRSFYQHFGSKDELLLALFEEAIRGFVDRLRREVERADDPVDRLHAYVTGLYRTAQTSAPGTWALTIYHLQLAEKRPADFAAAISRRSSTPAGPAAGSGATSMRPPSRCCSRRRSSPPPTCTSWAST
jgi:AcrR family transcriptional regulator